MGKLPFEKIERELLIKKQAETSREVVERKVEELIQYGVVNIDKPKGPTSHQVSDYVQKILKIKKAGHSGTLDPAVTGVLPIALSRATRIVQTLLPAGKEYVCIMHLHKEVEEDKIRKAIKKFTGKIMQKPPLKSAVKRVIREREIYYIDILEIEDKDVLFVVGCEAGTYIRMLCHQIGQELGVGAHMAELRRTKAGPFEEDSLVTLQDLTDAFYYYKEEGKEEYLRKAILPIEFAVSHLPKIYVLDTTISSLCNGVNLKIPGISKLDSGIGKKDMVAVMTLADELIAVGTARMDSEEIMKESKGVAVLIHKVFMQNNKI
ncbi:RNA-guided pseudouridylation complex pseudouridine synthase subunit Cbf5 [Candidatus Woesearchaeota archaeon]|nr:RNA-guided pseudouridylation complex pseudouridine synthase subunit Cbf5 [Candidatus Woesearchaeota archaeon]